MDRANALTEFTVTVYSKLADGGLLAFQKEHGKVDFMHAGNFDESYLDLLCIASNM